MDVIRSLCLIAHVSMIANLAQSREGPSGVRIDNHLDGSPGNSVVTDSGEHTKQLSVLTTVGHHRISGRAI